MLIHIELQEVKKTWRENPFEETLVMKWAESNDSSATPVPPTKPHFQTLLVKWNEVFSACGMVARLKAHPYLDVPCPAPGRRFTLYLRPGSTRNS